MPFSSVSELPSNIKKLPANKQRQFMHVFNGAFSRAKKDGKSTKEAEKSAFAQANGVVFKKDHQPDSSDVHVDGLLGNRKKERKSKKEKKKEKVKNMTMVEKFVDTVHGLWSGSGDAEEIKKVGIYDPETGQIKPHDIEREDTFESHTHEKTEYRDTGTKTTGDRTSRSTFSTEVIIKSIDKREWIIYGVVMEPTAEGELVEDVFVGQIHKTDSHNHFTTDVEIRKSMIAFMEDLDEYGNPPHNIQHDDKIGVPATVIIENYQAPIDFVLGGEIVKKGSWVQGTKINDLGLRKAIEDGSIAGYSIEGRGLLTRVA